MLAVVLGATLAAGAVHAVLLGAFVDRSVTDLIEHEDARALERAVVHGLPPGVFDTPRALADRERDAQAMVALLRDHGGFRIKVYDATGTILWSDEPRLIGRSFPDNRLVVRALAGEVVSKIEAPSRSEHVYESGRAAVVAEVYVPVRDPATGRVQGIVEVYRDATLIGQGLSRTRRVLWFGAAIATLGLCAGLATIFVFSHARHARLQRALASEAERLDAVVGGIGAGLALIDRSHRVVWTNRVFAGWFGGNGNLVGRPCFEAAWGRTARCADCPPHGGVDRSARLPDGRLRLYRVQAWPVEDRAGGEALSLELCQDVTEQVELHRQLLQASKLAAVGELAGGVAHEINNPAGVIVANATRLLRRAGAHEREGLEMIARNATRIGEIASRLLRFARWSPGARAPISLNAVVEEALALVRHRDAFQQVMLECELAADLPPVLGCANELVQVCVNLFNNALDEMPAGGRLRIRTARDGDSMRLDVIDSGRGIAPEHLDRLFTPFFTTKEDQQSTGLGLAISQRIAADHGGGIQAHNEPAGGARFTVSLPVAAAPR